MGKAECAAWTLYPSLLGLIFTLIAENVGGTAFGIFYYAAPILMFIGWFWAGRRYRKQIKNPLAAIPLGNCLGILSMLVYFWQEYLAEERISWLHKGAQYFACPLNGVTVGAVARFSPEVNGVTQVSNTAIQVLGFVLVVLTFTGGYFLERNKEKMEEESKQ